MSVNLLILVNVTLILVIPLCSQRIIVFRLICIWPQTVITVCLPNFPFLLSGLFKKGKLTSFKKGKGSNISFFLRTQMFGLTQLLSLSLKCLRNTGKRPNARAQKRDGGGGAFPVSAHGNDRK